MKLRRSISSRFVFRLLLAAAAVGSSADAQGSVVAPPLWYSGDTHVHVQLCGTSPDLSLADIYAEQQARALDVACVQLWNNDGEYGSYASLVTGSEEALTAADPEHVMQVGIEVSQFVASQFGHPLALNVPDGSFPSAFYPAPILDHFRAAPGVVTGYAHVRWPQHYGPLTPGQIKHFAAAMPAVDLALGRIDFLEFSSFGAAAFPVGLDIRGVYYKVLNAGLRVALTGGSDNSCLPDDIGDYRSFARIDEDPLTFDKWTAAIRAGRTTAAVGDDLFLDLDVDGAGIGSQVELASPATALVTVTLHATVGLPRSGTIDVVQGGAVVATEAYSLPAGGVASATVAVPVTESGWFVAVTGSPVEAITSPVYVIVDDQPICTSLDARYWTDILDTMVAGIGVFTTGSQTQEIVDTVGEAREIFEALAACDEPLPAGVTRYGASTASCKGPIAIGVSGLPQVGDPDFGLTCLNAPPDSFGFLAVSSGSDPAGTPVGDVTSFVDNASLVAFLSIPSNGGGFARFPLVPPASLAGLTFSSQFFWLNTPDCGSSGLSASDALELTFAP